MAEVKVIDNERTDVSGGHADLGRCGRREHGDRMRRHRRQRQHSEHAKGGKDDLRTHGSLIFLAGRYHLQRLRSGSKQCGDHTAQRNNDLSKEPILLRN